MTISELLVLTGPLPSQRVFVGRFPAAAIAAMLVLGACTNDPPTDDFEGLPSPSETATPAPSPTASAEAAGEIDVTATPDEITPESVTAVVNTLLAEYGEMNADILAMPVSDEPTLPDDFEERLDELFDGQYLERRTTDLQVLLVNLDNEREGLLPASEYGGLRFETALVQQAQPACIVAVGRVTRELTLIDGGPADYVSAVSLVPAPDAGGANPTQWRITDLLPNATAEGEPHPDERMLNASLDEYGQALEHACEED